MRRWREAGGQASSEYVALVALVAVVLMLAAGLTSGGVGGAVLAGVQRGLCQVADVRCPRPERPRDVLDACPLERSVGTEQLGTTIAVVRLGTGGTLTLEHLSDGRTTVTLAYGGDGGLEVGVGARMRLGRHVGGARVTAGAGGAWSSGRSWTFADADAARAFVDRYGRKATIGGQLLDGARSYCSLLCDVIGWRPHAELPEPDETYVEAGAAGRLTASFGLAQGSLGAGALLGRRLRRDGSSTWYVKLDAEATAGLALPVAGLDAGAQGEVVLGYELDPARRPVALHVSLSGALTAAASARLPAGRAGAHAVHGGGALAELDAELDLRVPANRAVAEALLAALADPAALASVPPLVQGLGARIARSAQLDRRVYVVRRSADGVGASVGLGAKLDGAFDRTTSALELIDAETRLPGLPFLPRDDCRPV